MTLLSETNAGTMLANCWNAQKSSCRVQTLTSKASLWQPLPAEAWTSPLEGNLPTPTPPFLVFSLPFLSALLVESWVAGSAHASHVLVQPPSWSVT